MKTDLTPIINAVIMLISAIITAYLIPYIRSKLTSEKRERTAEAVRIAVEAAEKLYGAGKGDEKLQYAAQQLLGQGYSIDIKNVHDELRAQIEAAVEELDIEKAAAANISNAPSNAIPTQSNASS